MATFMPGKRRARQRPWLARVSVGSRWTTRTTKCLGYFATRAEAEEAEEAERART